MGKTNIDLPTMYYPRKIKIILYYIILLLSLILCQCEVIQPCFGHH